MEQDRRNRALEAAIREGFECGVSDRTVPDIMEAVEARLRAMADFGLTRKATTRPEKDEDVDSKN